MHDRSGVGITMSKLDQAIREPRAGLKRLPLSLTHELHDI
jgi:hypothetical protein